jgi:hypothetical protein
MDDRKFLLYRIYQKPKKVVNICNFMGRESEDGDTFYESIQIRKSALLEAIQNIKGRYIKLLVFTNPFKKGDGDPDATLVVTLEKMKYVEHQD